MSSLDDGQLPISFTDTAPDRAGGATDVSEADGQMLLMPWHANIDVHVHSATEAVATISGIDPERAHPWLRKLLGNIAPTTRIRRVLFPVRALDRVLCVPAPHQVTLDATALAVGRGLWADALGLKPLRVRKVGRRLLASSWGWPEELRVRDAPWPAIAALASCGVSLRVDDNARRLLAGKIARSGATLARAGIVGSSVLIETDRPELIEALDLPALAYGGPAGTGRYKVPLLAAGSLLDHAEIRMAEPVRAAIRKAAKPPRKVPLPDDFPWTLYPFQATDHARATHILEHTGGVLLAGEMGSGKTTVSLAVVESKNLWPLFVATPLAAMSTWLRQLGEMGRSAHLATNSIPVDRDIIAEGDHDAVVISYDRLHRFADLIETYQGHGFEVVIADEIQRIRNPGSRRSRALRALAGAIPHRIGLSGTPITNDATDILAVSAFLQPSDWKPRLSTKDLAEMYPGDDPIESLADHLGSMMVRRRMEDTGAELPGRTIKRAFVPLTVEQRHALAELEEDARRAKEEGELGDHMHVFARLQKMRQVTNAPSAAGVPGPNPKVVTAVEIAAEFAADDMKTIIFVADRAAYEEAGRLLEAEGLGWVGIWGSTPIADRMGNETRFHEDDSVDVFLGTLAACGESLTLSPTARCTVFAALSYSPSAIAQAAARAYRMNTTDPVTEIYLSAQAPMGTLDDRMWELLTIKRALFAQVVDRTSYHDTAEKVSLDDLVYLLTGERSTADDSQGTLDVDDSTAQRAKSRKLRVDAAADMEAEERRRKEHAKATLYARKTGAFADDGSHATTRDDGTPASSDGTGTVMVAVTETEDVSESVWATDGDDDFDVEDGDDT